MAAVATIDSDMRCMATAPAACRRLMTLIWRRPTDRDPLVATIDDPSRICDSRDIGAYLGLVPRCHRPRGVDYLGGVSKCGRCGRFYTRLATSC